jgi:hypothetical protein
VCGRRRRGRRRLRRRWRVRPQQGGLGVSWCVPSVCGSACIANCICSARRSPSSSCARFCAPDRTRRPPSAARPSRTRPRHSLPGPLRLCAVLRSMPEPPARRPPRTRPDPQSACTACPQPAGSLEHALHSCTCYFTVPVLRQARNASKLQQTETGATNSWLFCCPRGHRFAAEAAIPDGRAMLSRAA